MQSEATSPSASQSGASLEYNCHLDILRWLLDNYRNEIVAESTQLQFIVSKL